MQNKTIHFISHFLSSEFTDTVLATFVDIVFVIFAGIVFVTFVDTLSVTFIILSHTIAEVSAMFFKYLPFSQVYVLRFQL